MGDHEVVGAGSAAIPSRVERLRTYLGIAGAVVALVGGVLGIVKGLHELGLISIDPVDIVAGSADAAGTGAGSGAGGASGGGSGGGGSQTSQHQLSVTIFGAPNGGSVTLPPDITCATGCSQSYDEGSQVRLVAQPNPSAGTRFIGWEAQGQSSPCTGVQSFTCDLTITGDVEVTATFDI
ncbi:MAG: InlB B-repeat-containing protein [Actinomycetota bacterium]